MDLSNCCLRKANLKNQDLRTTKLPLDLRGANLSNADLRGQYLSKTNLEGANLSGAKLKGAIIPFSLIRVNLRKTSTIWDNPINLDLSYSNLSENDLRGIDLSACALKGANLSCCRLNDSERERTYTPHFLRGSAKLPTLLDGANLSEIDLTGVNLAKSSLKGATLARTTIGTSTQLPIDLNNIDFSEADFKNFDLSKHDCSGAQFNGACFIGCQLPKSIIDSYEIIERSRDIIKLGSRIEPFCIKDREQHSRKHIEQAQPAEKVPITQEVACAAIHTIVQDTEAIYSFSLPRKGNPPHAHQIFMKRVDEDAVVLVWRDRETESSGAYVELGMIVAKGAMTEIPELRRVISAQLGLNFHQLISNDISDIIFGYHETSGRGPSIRISGGLNEGLYHTTSNILPPNLELARRIARL